MRRVKEPMDSRVVVPMTAAMLERVTEAANRNQCTLAEAVRQALASWLGSGGHEPQVEYRGGESRVVRGGESRVVRGGESRVVRDGPALPDVSAEDMGLGQPGAFHAVPGLTAEELKRAVDGGMVAGGAEKAERLARARAAMPAAGRKPWEQPYDPRRETRVVYEGGRAPRPTRMHPDDKPLKTQLAEARALDLAPHLIPREDSEEARDD